MVIKDEKALREKVETELECVDAFVEYMSSMIKAGIPDLFACVQGVSAWIELKFASSLPAKPQSGVLDHKFTGPQRRFLRDVTARGGVAFGLIGYVHPVTGEVHVAIFLHTQIQSDGQVSKDALLQCARQTVMVKGQTGAWLAKQFTELEVEARKAT